MAQTKQAKIAPRKPDPNRPRVKHPSPPPKKLVAPEKPEPKKPSIPKFSSLDWSEDKTHSEAHWPGNCPVCEAPVDAVLELKDDSFAKEYDLPEGFPYSLPMSSWPEVVVLRFLSVVRPPQPPPKEEEEEDEDQPAPAKRKKPGRKPKPLPEKYPGKSHQLHVAAEEDGKALGMPYYKTKPYLVCVLVVLLTKTEMESVATSLA